MNLTNKLKGIPKIRYVNLDCRLDRKEYMETQFDYWKIGDYERISSSKYLASEFDDWKHVLLEEPTDMIPIQSFANTVTHLELIKNWLESTNEKYLFLMEDDYDLSLIEHWNFDWEYMMNRIPIDWDCIQIGFESCGSIPFFLCPKLPYGTFFGACILNRSYAEKLIRLYTVDGKYKTTWNSAFSNIKSVGSPLVVDYFMCESGKTYCLPLITCNCEFGSFETNEDRVYGYHTASRLAYYDWWQNEHHKFSLDEFFTYGKSNDDLMTKHVSDYALKYNFSL